MADPSSPIDFEDVPFDEAHRMSCGPRMDSELYNALREKIQSLQTTAALMALPDDISPSTMKQRILRVAAELGTPVTIRKVPRGLLCWRSTQEALTQAEEEAKRLPSAPQQPQPMRRGRRRRG